MLPVEECNKATQVLYLSVNSVTCTWRRPIKCNLEGNTELFRADCCSLHVTTVAINDLFLFSIHLQIIFSLVDYTISLTNVWIKWKMSFQVNLRAGSCLQMSSYVQPDNQKPKDVQFKATKGWKQQFCCLFRAWFRDPLDYQHLESGKWFYLHSCLSTWLQQQTMVHTFSKMTSCFKFLVFTATKSNTPLLLVNWWIFLCFNIVGKIWGIACTQLKKLPYKKLFFCRHLQAECLHIILFKEVLGFGRGVHSTLVSF